MAGQRTDMSEVEEFKLLKRDYITKTLSQVIVVKGLSYEKLGRVGSKGILAGSRLETTTSYHQLLVSIAGIRTRMRHLVTKLSVYQSRKVS